MESKFHTFTHSTQSISLPERFTYPFHYTPHPLCVIGGRGDAGIPERTNRMAGRVTNRENVWCVGGSYSAGAVGYLAAFSGNLAGKNVHHFFVPPIYDLLQPDGFFRQEEEQINEINARIRTLQTSPALEKARHVLKNMLKLNDHMLRSSKATLKEMKEARDLRRAISLDRRGSCASHQREPASKSRPQPTSEAPAIF